LKRSMFLLIAAAIVLALGSVSAQAAPVNATGKWKAQVTSSNGLSSGTLTLNQVGTTVIGKGIGGMNTIKGTMVTDTEMNGTFDGPQGAGWLTVEFSADGKSFQGTWGFHGKKSSGSFIAKRVK
jgi:hypothetical protein